MTRPLSETVSSLRVLAKSVLIEAVRRKEIYVIVAVCTALIGAAMSLDFFGLGGLVKFYRETALQLMGISTALTVIVLATRQLPREFEHRTIYPLLARPVSRFTFLMGKTLAAWIAGLCVYLCLLLPVMVLVPRLEPNHTGTFWQMFTLAVPGLGLTAALGLALSLFLPKSLATGIGAVLLFGAATMANWRWIGQILHALPSSAKTNLTLRYTDGAPPMAGSDFLLMLLYVLLWTLILLTVSVRGFNRRALS